MAKQLSTQTINIILNALQTKGYDGAIKEVAKKYKKGLEKAATVIGYAAEQDSTIRKLVTGQQVIKFPVVDSNFRKDVIKVIPDEQILVDKVAYRGNVADAERWNNFVNNRFCPFTEYLQNFSVPEHKLVKKSDIFSPSKDNRTFVACCFDWHMGSRCEAEHAFNKKAWSSDECDRCVDQYIAEIRKMVANDKAGFDRCVILWGGDLYHSFTGETAKGTQLVIENVGEIQFDRIKNAMIRFVDAMLEIFDKVENHFVKGNHGGYTDYGLGSTVAAWYRTYGKRCTWNVSMNEITYFSLQNSAIVLTHGASAESKSKFSATRSAHNEQVGHRIFNQMSEENDRNYKYKYVFVGDKHHSRQEECNGFELLQVGSMVKADKYASSMYLTSRPSQLTCIFDERGCVSRSLVYFD